jgi:transposase InsO family protein
MVEGLLAIKFTSGVCQGCILGKHPERKFDKGKAQRDYSSLGMIHSDITGPFPQPSISIQLQHTVPYTPQQNGVAERKNRSLKEMANCMLQSKSLDPKLWDEAINCEAYIQNRVPHKSLKGTTPFEC